MEFQIQFSLAYCPKSKSDEQWGIGYTNIGDNIEKYRVGLKKYSVLKSASNSDNFKAAVSVQLFCEYLKRNDLIVRLECFTKVYISLHFRNISSFPNIWFHNFGTNSRRKKYYWNFDLKIARVGGWFQNQKFL